MSERVKKLGERVFVGCYDLTKEEKEKIAKFAEERKVNISKVVAEWIREMIEFEEQK